MWYIEYRIGAKKRKKIYIRHGDGLSMSILRGVDTDKPGECLAHCQGLLRAAVVGLDPVAGIEAALTGLVALFPAESRDWRREMQGGQRFEV